MKELVQRLNFLVGAIMIAAGFALAQIPWIRIAQLPDSDAFHLIQFHFLLTGAFSIWGALAKKPGQALASFGFLLLGENIWLAFLGVKSGDVHYFWPLSYAAAAAVNFSYLLVTDKPAEPIVEDDENSEREDGLIPPNFGATSNRSVLKLATLKIGIVALLAAITISLIFVVFLYGRLLNEVIGNHASISFQRLFHYFLSPSGQVGLIEVASYVVIIIVVYGGLFLFEALFSFLLQRRDASDAADIDRDLDHRERVYVQDALTSLVSYLDNKNYPNGLRAFYVFGAILAVSAFILVPVAVALAEGALDMRLEAMRTGDAAPIFYSGVIYIGGVAFSALGGLAIVWAIFQWLGARNVELGEYMFARAGWNSMNNRPRTPAELLWVMVRHLRIHRLRAGEPFDPAKFLHAAFREREGFIYKTTMMLIALAALFTAADLARFELVTSGEVSYSKYLHFQNKHVPLDAIDHVELRCNLFEPDKKTGEVILGVSYILVKRGAFRIDVLSDEAIKNRLAKIETLDANLSSGSKSFFRAATAGLLQGNKPSFIPDCAAEIEKRYSPEIAPRLEALLRIGEDLPRAAK